MAFGSATVSVRTKTKTKTKTNAGIAVKPKQPQASTSAAIPFVLASASATDDSSDDSDGDFAGDMMRQIEEEREADLLKAQGKRKGKGKADKGKAVKQEKTRKVAPVKKVDKVLKHQDYTLSRAHHSSSSSEYETASDDEDDEGEDGLNELNRSKRPYAISNLDGGRLGGKKKSKLYKYEDAEAEEHMKGRWRTKDWQKKAPWIMSQRRKKLEEKYNPLIKLLDIKISVQESDDDRMPTVLTDTDSDSDDSLDEKSKPRGSSGSTQAQFAFEREDESSDVDVKPDIKLDLDDEDEEPPTDDEPPTEDEEYEDPLDAALRKRDAELMQEKQAAIKREEVKVKLEQVKMEKVVIDDDEDEDEDPLETALRKDRMEREAEARQKLLGKVKREDEDTSMEVDSPVSVTTFVPFAQKNRRPRFEMKSFEQLQTPPLVLDAGKGIEVPKYINRYLRPYQREGIQFLWRQYSKNMGGVLGDDMGLGKTIQVIGFLAAIMHKTNHKKSDRGRRKYLIDERTKKTGDYPKPSDDGPTCLIACPASVIHNWTREFETWGYFDVLPFEGADKLEKLGGFRRGYYDVIIGSIESVRDNYQALCALDISVVIVDEAHRVKNPHSATTIAFNEFPSRLRYGLTGTAIQNRLSELWTILDWANPGSIGTLKQWTLWVSDPLKFARKSDATQEMIKLGKERAMGLAMMLLPKFFIRRQKKDVQIQLPKKTDNIIICPLTPLQADVYKNLLALDEVQIILTADEPCECGTTDESGLPYAKGRCCHQNWAKSVLKYITLFQKVSNHLALIYPNKEDRNQREEKYNQDLEWTRAAFPGESVHRRQRGDPSITFDPQLCGKWAILVEFLAIWKRQGDKVLIFSLSLNILDLIKQLMEETGHNFVTLDGRTAAADRMTRVDTFNNDPEVFCFLISTRAGGVGLNLTAANRVVIFDPNWNPSHDLQAMDRAYRFGQTRDVMVYRLIGGGTLEELIYNRQAHKRATANVAYEASSERRLYAGVEGEKEHTGELYGVKNIFRFDEGRCLTKSVIENAEIAALEYAMKHTTVSFDDQKKGRSKTTKGKVNDSEDEVSDEEQERRNIEDAKLLVDWSSKSPEDAAREAKNQAEMDEISAILNGNGAFATVSDDHLGSTEADALVERLAVKNGTANKVKEERARQKKSATATWDPIALKKKGPVSGTAPVHSVVPKAIKKTLVDICRDRGIKGDFDLEDVVRPSGYTAPELAHRLGTLRGDAYKDLLNSVIDAYVKSVQ